MQQPTRNAAPPPSYWRDVTAPGPDCPPLAGDVVADVAIVGAGFTGLSTALHLRERGARVVVVEAVEPGHGASGRNNGQVIPTLTRLEPDDLVARYGAAGDRFADLVRDCAALLFDLTRRHAIAAEAEQTGWIQPAHSPGRLKISEKRVRQWGARGAPVELLSRDDVARMTGSPIWSGGFWNRSGGHVNPLALARGLACAALAAGAAIHSRTPAMRIAREAGKWRVETPGGALRADGLLLATNAYSSEFASALAPDIAREVVPVLSWQMATTPLGDNVRRAILPGRQAVSDTHGDLYFMRWDARGALISGGALVVPANGAARLRARIGARLRRVFPQLGDVEFSHVWNGYIGMTDDYGPRLHRLGPNGYAWVGCNGRGVGLAAALGREFAAALSGEDESRLALPFSAVRPLPLHGLVRRVAPLMLLDYRRRDAREIA
ncbi:MAG: FAD-binding oxidoreductase [Methylobacteriaceae bacterium]|nr:FAD-binding oxidoreductase [Methylobacteriaceae bacterium]